MHEACRQPVCGVGQVVRGVPLWASTGVAAATKSPTVILKRVNAVSPVCVARRSNFRTVSPA